MHVHKYVYVLIYTNIHMYKCVCEEYACVSVCV